MASGLSVLRCPACGQQLESSADRCPLCELQLGDDPITGDDVTPYARAHVQGLRGWPGMVTWVWSAGAGRLKHLALMRSSAASRRFARVNVLLFALGVAMSQWSMVGWKWVYPRTHSDGAEASVNPTGAGWFQVASIPRSLTLERGADVPSDLWWNPAQSLIAVPLAGVLALFMIWWVGVLTRTGAAWFHRRPYRKQRRLAAAIQYSAAWVQMGRSGSQLISQPSTAGMAGSRRAGSARSSRVFAWPRRPSRMKSWRERMASWICGMTVFS